MTRLELNLLVYLLKLQGDGTLEPVLSTSVRWSHWVSQLGLNTCKYCRDRHGCIFAKGYEPKREIPVHPYCMCRIVAMDAIRAGTATIDKEEGADYYLKKLGVLPDNYLTKDAAIALGWKNKKGNLKETCGEVTLGGMIYENKESKLPDKNGRIWYEADINYLGGYRNSHRILYSNDGLLFVTYDHYKSFFEIV